jgi:hypothetical protein
MTYQPAHDRREIGRERRGVEGHPVRLRPGALDDGARIRPLVEAGIVEVRGHRLLMLVTVVRDGDGDRGGVDPSREARADGNVASQLQSHGVEDRLADGGHRVRWGGGRLERPVAADAQAIRAERQRMPRLQPLDAVEERLVPLVEIALLEVGAHRTEVGAGPPQHPRLARELEAASVEPEVERLDPQPVARAEQRPALGVPDDERPHAVEALYAPLAPLAVSGEYYLAVGRGREPMTACAKLVPQFDVVVDLPVVQEVQRGVAHGLQACVAEVDDCEPEVAEADAVVGEDAPAVRPAVRKAVEPDVDRRTVGRPVELDDAAEAAHQRGRLPARA